MKLDSRLLFLFVLLICILSLELSVAGGLISPFILSRPSKVVVRLWEMFFSEKLASHLAVTTGFSIVSAIIGFIIGTITAFFMASLNKTQKYAEFLLDFVRSIPLTTLIPIFIAIYGIGSSPKIAIGAVSAAFTAALTVYLGLKAIKKNRANFIALYRPTLKTTIFKLYLIDGRSILFTSMRLSISIALILIIVSEMFIGTEFGIGKLIMDKSYTDDRPGQYAVVLMTGFIGLLLNKFFNIIQPKEYDKNE